MMQNDFESFIKLVELDQELYKLSSEKSTLISEIEQLNSEIEEVHHKVEKSHQHVIDSRKKVHLLELDLKSLESQESEKKNKIERASTTKEYYSLEQELESIKKRKSDIELILFGLWDQLENIEKNYEKLVSSLPGQTREIEKDLQNLNRRIIDLDNQINVLVSERPSLEKSINADLIEQYNLMRESVVNPVVAIIDNNCAGCFMTLTSQEMSELRQNQLPKCKYCYRLLYLKQRNN